MDKNTIIKDIRQTSNVNGGALLIFSVILYAGSYLTSYIIYLLSPDSTYEAISGYYITAMNAINIVAMIIGAFFIKFALRKKRTVVFSFNRPVIPTGEVVIFIIITLSFAYISGFASDLIISAIENAGITMNDIEPDTSTPFLYILNIIAMIVLAPIFEEVLFRGGLTGSVSEYGGFSMALAVGIMFGLWHENIYQIIYAAALGTALCWLTMRTGSIFPALIVHFLYNFDEVPIMLFDLIDTELADMAYMLFLIFSFVVTVSGLIFFLSMFFTERERLSIKNKVDDYADVTESEKFLAYFTSPLMIIAVLWSIIMTVLNAAGQ
jgi:membrane protease YdiL (CAAX protease family)